MTTAETFELAEGVLATLDGATAEELYAFATGVELAGPPLTGFARPLRYLGDLEEGDTGAKMCAVLAMRRALTTAADDGLLLPRLAKVETPFWTAVSGALAKLAQERAAGSSSDHP